MRENTRNTLDEDLMALSKWLHNRTQKKHCSETTVSMLLKKTDRIYERESQRSVKECNRDRTN